jgi:hypothetical protein
MLEGSERSSRVIARPSGEEVVMTNGGIGQDIVLLGFAWATFSRNDVLDEERNRARGRQAAVEKWDF